MYRVLRELLFALPPDEAHEIGMLALSTMDAIGPLRELVRRRSPVPDAAATTKMGLSFRSPIGLAGGFDKNARAPRALAALGFGFLELGTVTAIPQEENPKPNLFRLPADRALVNRLGFPNEGAAEVAARFLGDVGKGALDVPVGFSIGKSRVVPLEPLDGVIDDYRRSFRAVKPASDFVVVNVSSPNTRGLRALQGSDLARALLDALVQENRAAGPEVPLLLKISPDLTVDDLAALLREVRGAGIAGVIATNTTLSRAGLASRADLVRAIGAGGLSGPPLLARTLEVLPIIRDALGPDATVIAVGGIGCAEDVRRCLAAGADLVQLYTSFIYEGPGLPSRLARETAS